MTCKVSYLCGKETQCWPVSLLPTATSNSVRTIMSVQTLTHYVDVDYISACALSQCKHFFAPVTGAAEKSMFVFLPELLWKISCHLRWGCNSLHFQQSGMYLSSNWLESLSVPQQESSPLSFSSRSLIDHWRFWDTEKRCDHHPNASSVRMCVHVDVFWCVCVYVEHS